MIGSDALYVSTGEPFRCVIVSLDGAVSRFALPEGIEIEDAVGAGNSIVFREVSVEKQHEDGHLYIGADLFLKTGNEVVRMPYVDAKAPDLSEHNTLVASRGTYYFPDAEIRYIIYDSNQYANAGSYSNGTAALRSLRRVYVIDVANRQVIQTTTSEGRAPAGAIRSGDDGKAAPAPVLTIPEIFNEYFRKPIVQ